MAEDNLMKYRMVVIGGSAGSLEVIMNIVSELPDNTGCSFIIVVHRMNTADSTLEEVLGSKCRLEIKEAEDKESIQENKIYTAPPDYHLLIENDRSFSLDSSEKVNFCRPSIDVTFISAAEVYQSSLIGIVLSGANADGAEGLQKIAEFGGYTIVQDPATAEVTYMPQQAIESSDVKEISGKDSIGSLLVGLIG